MGSRRSTVWLAALAALGACLVAFWVPPPLEHPEVETHAAREQAGSAAALQQRTAAAPACRPTHDPLDVARLSRLTTQLERASALRARCRLLDRIAHIQGAGESVVALIARFTAPSRPEELRLCAVAALGDVAEPAAITALQALSSTTDMRLLHAVVQALAEHEEPAAHDALLAYARTGRSQLQVEATVTLAELGDPEASELVSALLADATRGLARRLIAALGNTHDPSVVPLLRTLLADDTKDRGAVLEAMGELGHPDATQVLLDQLARDSRHFPQILHALSMSSDPGARRALIAAAEGGQPHCDPTFALRAVSELEGDDARALMLRALQGADASRQGIATAYFSQHADEAAVPGLLALVNADGRGLAADALEALAAIGGDDALSAMEAEARNQSPLQASALRTLAQMAGGEDSARDIAIELTRRGGDGAAEAADLLASDETPEAQAALLTAARRPDFGAMQAITALSQRSDAESRELVVQLARADGSPTRAHALTQLVEAEAPEALDSVRTALSARDEQLRESAVGMLAAIGGEEAERVAIQTSAGTDAPLALAAIRELGEFGTPTSNDALAQLAQSKNTASSAEALQALADNQPERAAEVFQQLPASSDPALLSAALSLSEHLPEPALEGVIERALLGKDESVESDLLTLLDQRDERAALRAPLAALAEKSGAPEQVRQRALALLSTLSGAHE